MAPAVAGGLDAPSQAFGLPYLATLPHWGLRPGSGEDQSAALQALIDTVSERGGGAVILPQEYEGTRGSDHNIGDIHSRA